MNKNSSKTLLSMTLAAIMILAVSLFVLPAGADKLRIHGGFLHGPGDHTVTDPVSGLAPENPPYTDPEGPFYPQHEQAPGKDFVTFNPAIMDHNQGWPDLTLYVNNNTIQSPKEKVFKRMWYEKEWFKDETENGVLDVLVIANQDLTVCPMDFKNPNPNNVRPCSIPQGTPVTSIPFDDVVGGIVDRYTTLDLNQDNIPDYTIAEHNNDPIIRSSDKTIGEIHADIYGPSINQEFTYMTLDDFKMPIMVQAGSKIFIPMAHDPADPYPGLNSFDSAGMGVKDTVRVESEETLGMDIDNDGIQQSMNPDGRELSGDESVVFVLENKRLNLNQWLQFFDNKIQVIGINNLGNNPSADIKVCDNEDGGSTTCTAPQTFGIGAVMKFQRGTLDNRGPFYVKVIGISSTTATVEVGRLFGQTYANIAANPLWNQKAFIVNATFYNVVAIKADDNMFKYITFRQKLPKEAIKLYGKHLKVYGPGEILAEMPPFNMPHEIVWDILTANQDASSPLGDHVKIGEKVAVPALAINFTNEDIEARFKGELREIYREFTEGENNESTLVESWMIEWFDTHPKQFTDFMLPAGQDYLVTSAFRSNESDITIWNNNPEEPLNHHIGDRVKFRYNANDNTGLYVNPIGTNESSLRLYGTFNEGPGDQEIVDSDTSLPPENKPYTDPMAPFYPKAEQAPRKDFVSFNPAIMDHNDESGMWSDLMFLTANGPQIQRPMEKVYKRMWYEKEWFKDHDMDGDWDLLVVANQDLTICPNPINVPQSTNVQPCNVHQGDAVASVHMSDTNAIREWRLLDLNNDNVPDFKIAIHNNDPIIRSENKQIGEIHADIYGPAIDQEFTYFMVNDDIMPVAVKNGSRILIPMAHDANNSYAGINSFDAAGTGTVDTVRVESEETLNMDLDADSEDQEMNPDGRQLSGDESVVLVLDNKRLNLNQWLQFFDNKIQVVGINNLGSNPSVDIQVCDNEGGGSTTCTAPQTFNVGTVMEFQRGSLDNKGPFFVKVVGISSDTATVTVGRLFGKVTANIGANQRWNQKAFIVDGVFYNVVAIKTESGEDHSELLKYITIRQKLPKDEIKLYGKHLTVWPAGRTLPELPPFNMNHKVVEDVKDIQDHVKVGDIIPMPALNITYIKEADELRFKGELREIYTERHERNESLDEFWAIEWFQTIPYEFTEFTLPQGQLYHVTLSWFAPQSKVKLWNNNNREPIRQFDGARVQFLYDPTQMDDLYILGAVGDASTGGPGPTPNCDKFDLNCDGTIQKNEAIAAVVAYFNGSVTKAEALDVVIRYFSS